MAIDRIAALRNAEKLLKQGKLDAAIAEYARIVDDQPRDWSAANTLGDLYVRTAQTDKAVEVFLRIAATLHGEGFASKAGAVYKKIIKLKPDHEPALLQAAEIAGAQGLLADARAHLNTVADRRRSRNDTQGVAEIQMRLAALDPSDYATRVAAAAARAQSGDVRGAVDDLKSIAGELTDAGRPADAVETLRRAAALDPDDDMIREQLLAAYLAAGDFERARPCATTGEQLKALASVLEAKGRPSEALDVLRDAARLAPSDTALALRVARTLMAQGDFESAAEHLTPEGAGGDPELLLTVAEIRLLGGRVDEGLAVLRGIVDHEPARRDDVMRLVWTMAERAPDAAFAAIDVVADASVRRSDWADAAATVEAFVARVPNHIPALMRLVEICLDGGLDAATFSAQGQLADAYIAAGSIAEGLVIAEDLVAHEPWEAANIDRVRRVLTLSGEADPDAVIAERLSGQSPFMSELTVGREPPRAPEAAPAPPVAPIVAPPVSEPMPTSARRPLPPDPFRMGVNSIDLDSILRDIDPPAAPTAHATSQSVEVDLSIVLGDLKAAPPPAAGAASSNPSTPQPGAAPSGDLDGVFEHLRHEAARRASSDVTDHEYIRGVALQEAGEIDEAIDALTQAARAPKRQFAAASRLGRLYRSQGRTAEAIDWLERAAQAPSPSADDSHLVLYELADLLEATGETARALAVCMELEADIGDYRDLRERIDRLAKVQARG